MILWSKKLKLLTGGVISATLIVAVLLGLKHCDGKKRTEITSEKLTKGERSAIIVSGNSIAVVEDHSRSKDGHELRNGIFRGRKPESTGNAEQTVKRLDGARDVRISIDDQGQVSVKARRAGFILEPGIGIGSTLRERRLLLDAQIVFYGRHGINAGVGFNGHGGAEPFIAYSYTAFSNTSLLIGLDSSREALVGIRVKF